MPIGRRLLLALLLALPLLAVPPGRTSAAGTTWYVSPTGNDTWSCLFEVTPCRTIQAAINKAASNDGIVVAAGTYSTATNGEAFPITIGKSLMIYGDGLPTTTIDAASSGTNVITASDNINLHISGFTIRGGNRGIELNGFLPGAMTGSISYCRITGNEIGVYTNAGVEIRYSDISGNAHSGIYNYHSSASITGNSFGLNGSGGADAAINNELSNPWVVNNVIGWNNGSGIYNFQSSPTITNNTIFFNYGGNGIANVTSSNPIVTNNIITSNGVYGMFADGTSSPVNSYNDVWANAWAEYSGTAAGTGSISADPRFVGLLDAHLLCSSPAIDHGNNGAPSVPSVDYHGHPRPVGGIVDMGAYEWQSLIRCPVYLPIVLR